MSRLSPEQLRDLHGLLTSGDPDTVGVLLEMAARGDVTPSLDDLERAVAVVTRQKARSTLARFIARPGGGGGDLMRHLRRSADPVARARGVEAMAVGRLEPADNFQPLMADDDETVRGIAAAATLAAAPDHAAARTAILSLSGADAAEPAIHVLSRCAGAKAMPILEQLGTHGDPQIRALALTAALDTGTELDDALRGWAWRGMADPATDVRAAAIAGLTRLAPEAELDRVAAAGLRDAFSAVRQTAVQALIARGEAALPAVEAQLAVGDAAAEAAIEAVGGIGGKHADDILFAYLESGPLAIGAPQFDAARPDSGTPGRLAYPGRRGGRRQ